jgi:hypothetical protein
MTRQAFRRSTATETSATPIRMRTTLSDVPSNFAANEVQGFGTPCSPDDGIQNSKKPEQI